MYVQICSSAPYYFLVFIKAHFIFLLFTVLFFKVYPKLGWQTVNDKKRSTELALTPVFLFCIFTFMLLKMMNLIWRTYLREVCRGLEKSLA